MTEAAGAVDGEVVGDVHHAALEVGLLHDLEVAGDVVGGFAGKRLAVAGVVDGDAADAVHRLAGLELEGQADPGGPGHDVAVLRPLGGRGRGDDDPPRVHADGAGAALDEVVVVHVGQVGHGRIGAAAGERDGDAGGGQFQQFPAGDAQAAVAHARNPYAAVPGVIGRAAGGRPTYLRSCGRQPRPVRPTPACGSAP